MLCMPRGVEGLIEAEFLGRHAAVFLPTPEAAIPFRAESIPFSVSRIGSSTFGKIEIIINR
jgi:hypothetical protein